MSSDPLIRPFRSPTFSGRPYRILLGDDGREWVVYTIPASSYDRRAGLSLLFESVDVMRRLRTFPENWLELADAELYAISLRPNPLPGAEQDGVQDGEREVDLTPVDRRWHPAKDRSEWDRATRQSIFEAIRRCVAHALREPVGNGIPTVAAPPSQTVLHELEICAQAYARALFTLGHSPVSATAVIVAAAKRASEPAALDPSIVASLERWCRAAAPAGS